MDFQFSAQYDQTQNLWKINVSGEIDIYNSEELKKELNGCISQKAADLQINCQNLEYIDSTGLGSLVSVLKNIKQHDHNIHLLNVKSNVAKVFRITELDKVFMLEEEGERYE